MNVLTDKFILLLLCMSSMIFYDCDPSFVAAFFTAIAFSMLLYAFKNRYFHLTLLTLYAILLCASKAFCFFLPLIVYDYLPESVFKGKSVLPWTNIPAALIAIPGILFQFQNGNEISLLYFTFVGCLTALLLRWRTISNKQLSRQYQKTRDDDTEIQLLLEEKNQSLREKQNSEIYAATLKERNRIAREIHDNVGHMLTRAILMTGALKTINKESALKEPLDQLDHTLNQAMDSIRQSVHDLHDSSVNLADSLQTLIREFSFCPVTLTCEISPELPNEVKYSFISIVKESLVNIARHSNATKASVLAVEHPGFYQLIIRDNGSSDSANNNAFLSGRASDSQRQADSTGGMGLANIQSRVKALNGNLQIQAAQGFRIYITVPKQNI